MKKLAQYSILLIIIASFVYFIYDQSLNPCDKKLQYSIGIFSPQFGISQIEFKNYIAESEKIWENALNRDLFQYNPKSNFKINLIYDQRQLSTIQKQKTEFGLSAVENIFKKLDAEFNLFKSEYEQKVSLHEQSLVLFNNRKSTYDSAVTFWNNKGGAPKDKFESLENERRYLNTEAGKLNLEAVSINEMAKQLNTLLKERNIKALEYNKIAEAYNKKYGRGLEFNQAEYISGGTGQINVYQFGNKKDLVLALTHELGHALSMEHTENPKSIMYYLTGANTETSLPPSVEDLAELKRVCKE